MNDSENSPSNIENLIEELDDEALAACVGGTGYLNPNGKHVGKPVDPTKDANGEGLTLDPNGSLRSRAARSDRNIKDHFSTVDVHHVLEKVASLPITTWHYKDEAPTVRHIGPMAQDFADAFKVGDDDRSIHLVDANGVALAAIQALYNVILERDHQIEALRTDLKQLKQELKQDEP